MRIHVCFLCGEKGLFLNQERVWVIEDCFCFRKKVCFFLFCSYVFNRLLTWPTDQPRYASYKSYIMSNPWHPQFIQLLDSIGLRISNIFVHEQDRTEHPHVFSHSHSELKITFFSQAFYRGAYDLRAYRQDEAYDLRAFYLLVQDDDLQDVDLFAFPILQQQLSFLQR